LLIFRKSLNENYNFGGLRYTNKSIRRPDVLKMLDYSNEPCTTYNPEEIKNKFSFFKRAGRYIYNCL